MAMREHVLDGVKAAPAATFWGTWFAGVNWPHVGAFLMAVYTVLLIMDKLGVLLPVRQFFSRLIVALLLLRQAKGAPLVVAKPPHEGEGI